MSRAASGKMVGPKGRGIGLAPVRRIVDLTERQRDVALLLARGKFNAEIAKELSCSIKTVDTHRGSALARLGLRNNVELALLAIRQGLIPSPIDLKNYADVFAEHDRVSRERGMAEDAAVATAAES